jgi:hypothetical protein
MQKTEERENARLHRAYSSRWKRGHRRDMAQAHFNLQGDTDRRLAQWREAVFSPLQSPESGGR